MSDSEFRPVDAYGPGLVECRVCGKTIPDKKFRRQAHRNVCRALRSQTFDGICPMCGEEYESYTSHLNRCDGGRRD